VEIVDIIHRTRNVTNYTVVNNYVVNRSIECTSSSAPQESHCKWFRAASVIRHPIS